MAFELSVKRYLRALQNEYSASLRGGQHTAELSYRAPMHELFKNLSHDINPTGKFDIILEPKNQGRVGRPDWRIHDSISLGIYGYIEGKGLSQDTFDITPYKRQIDKYLTLGHKLIISDGIDFVFCFVGAVPTIISLIDKSKMDVPDWSTLPIDPRFKFFMGQFFSDPAPQLVDENKLIELVAIRTRILADDIKEYAELSYEEAIDDTERQIVTLLSDIKELVYNHNDPSLRNGSTFADFTAQVIMFCLLYAHRVLCTSDDAPVNKEKKIREYAFRDVTEGEALLPFRNLMAYLRDNVYKGLFIGQWVDECISFLSFVHMTEQQLLNPDYHRLFELFLSKYDPQTRFDYGAFYTPKILADFVVKLTNQVVAQNFDGLSIYDERNTLIDPCCGTGSFLEEIILHDDTNGRYNLCGLEILPAPYMLANYRMAVIEKIYGKKNVNANIILANTLSNCIFGVESNEDSIEGKELKRAKEIVSRPLRLIIGNPPCSDSIRKNVSADFSIINNMMDDFRPPINERHGRQNIQKQINNPFMQFLRWSCEKLLNTKNHSVLSLVIPLSFLEGESYKYARKYLVEHFSKIWAVAIDADARTGVRSDSLFSTLQGRALIVLTKKYGDDAAITEINFADMSHETRKQKEILLGADGASIMMTFTSHRVNENTYSFMPVRSFNEELYKKFWPVSSGSDEPTIFINQCSGAKLAPTALLTHVKAPIIKRRSREIATGGLVAAHSWIGRQDKKVDDTKIIEFQRAMNSCSNQHELDAALSTCIRPCSFRPFVTSNVLLWDVVFDYVGGVGGGGTRVRPEIKKMYDTDGTIGFALSHAPKDLDESLGQFASFCWNFPDNDLSRRGNGHIYMNQYIDMKTNTISNNIYKPLLEALTGLIGLTESECSRKLVFYSYAILCSQVYLDEFYGALFTVNQSDRRSRIPIVNDKYAFLKLANLGEEIASLEKPNISPENVLGYNYDQILAQLNSGFHLEHSKSASSNPYDDENEQLILRNEVNDEEIKIYCPVAIQKFTVSGYNVIKDCWLKFHSYRYTKCEFTKDDLKELLNLLNAITLQSRLVAEVDKIVHDIINGEIDILDPLLS